MTDSRRPSFPCPQSSLPIELKKEIFLVLAADVARQRKRWSWPVACRSSSSSGATLKPSHSAPSRAKSPSRPAAGPT
jgi:hypothetical protein